MALPALLLVVALAVLAWVSWRDRTQFAAFRLYTASEDRQRFYRGWLFESLALFVAGSLAALGARVTLVSGPTSLVAPPGTERVSVGTAREMLAACEAALPADAAVFVAAVSDWRPDTVFGVKLKKGKDGPPSVQLVENPDILATLAHAGPRRPRLVVGFAAETNDLEANARAKLARKGCDWIVANDVSESAIMGGDENEVLLIDAKRAERWARASKDEVARRLADRIAGALA